MAHFARLDADNIVTEVLVVDNAIVGTPEVEQIGRDWLDYFDRLRGLPAARWVQTSYNSKFRGRFAGIGFTYDSESDVFIGPEVDESFPFLPGTPA